MGQHTQDLLPGTYCQAREGAAPDADAGGGGGGGGDADAGGGGGDGDGDAGGGGGGGGGDGDGDDDDAGGGDDDGHDDDDDAPAPPSPPVHAPTNKTDAALPSLRVRLATWQICTAGPPPGANTETPASTETPIFVLHRRRWLCVCVCFPLPS